MIDEPCADRSDSWARTRVVVTGAAGFLGSHLCHRLIRYGCEVVGLDNLSTGRLENLVNLQNLDQFEFLHCDVADEIRVAGDVDYVFHLASPASPTDYALLGLATLAVGSAGTWNALRLAESTGARFVLASTSEVYGDPTEHPQRETYCGNVNPVGPRSVYDEAKRYAEALTTAYGRERSVDTGIVRIFNTYGPRMRADDGRAVPEFVNRALHGRPLLVTGDGLQTRSLCFVTDMVDGLLAMAAAGGEKGPINLGNPHEITMLELAITVRDLCDSTSELRLVGRPDGDPRRRCPDVSTAHRLLRWSAQVDLRAGLLSTIDAARTVSADSGYAMARLG